MPQLSDVFSCLFASSVSYKHNTTKISDIIWTLFGNQNKRLNGYYWRTGSHSSDSRLLALLTQTQSCYDDDLPEYAVAVEYIHIKQYDDLAAHVSI